MTKRRAVETARFQVMDASGRLYTVVRISDQQDVGGLDGSGWIETGGRLLTTEGHAVNADGSDNFRIVNLGVDTKRVDP
ncbi:hypothetical protein D3C71_1860730 [compost metagenome]